MPTVNVGVAANGLGYTGYIPPDTIGAAGPSSYVEAVNLNLGLYNKSGTVITTKSFSSFFSSLGGIQSLSDPVVTYDTFASKYVVGLIDFNQSASGDSRFDVAVSNTSNPATLNTTDWTFRRYDVSRDSLGGPYLSDYPKLGYNADAYVVTFNMFPDASGSQHVDTLAFAKSLPATGFVSAVPTSVVNLPGMTPAVMHDATTGGPQWFVGTGSGTNIKVVKMTNVLSSTPTFTGYTVSVPSYGSMSAPRQPGGSMSWTFDTRVFNAAMRDNLLVAAHAVKVGSNDVARWYEFSTAGSTPTLVQSGNINGGGTTDTYFPSIDINAADNLGMTYIESSSTEYMSTYVTGRLTSDPTGTMETGVGPSQLRGNSNYTVNRCGDYSGTSVDPSDNMTFWSANEYKGSSTWNTGFVSYSLGATTGATHYSVTSDTNPTTAGQSFNITVSALDSSNNVYPAYAGTVHFTSSDAQAQLPANYTFQPSIDHGVHTFSVILKTAGSRTITASDTASSSIVGSVSVTVAPAPAASFTVGGFGLGITAGNPVNATVTAKDAYGNTATGYAGTVTFSSSDPQAGLPADSQLVNGTGTFPVTLYTAGRQSVTATDTVDSTITGSANNILVGPAAFAQLAVFTDASDPDIAGTPFDVAVVAQDAYGNTVTGYRGTITFSSGDPYGATLPPDYTFVASDQGTAIFYGETALYTAGTWDVTATDVNNGISGSAYVNVQAAPAVALIITAPPSASSGAPFDVTVTAVDPYGNTDTNYGGTVTWTTSDPDPGVVLPADYTFQSTDQGQVTFPGGVTLITPGGQTLTVTDTASGINGTTTVTVTSPSVLDLGNNKGNNGTSASTTSAAAPATAPAVDAAYAWLDAAGVGTTTTPAATTDSAFHALGMPSLDPLALDAWPTLS